MSHVEPTLSDAELLELYGVMSSLKPEAIDELRRSHEQESEESACVWEEPSELLATTGGPDEDNPYRPSVAPPSDASVKGNQLRLRAAVSTDDDTIRWFAQTYAGETWQTPLVAFCVPIVWAAVGFLLQLDVSWVSCILLFVSMILAQRYANRWQAKRVERKFHFDPFRSEAYYWVTVRCHTMTIANETRIETWAMSEVFMKAKTRELIVFELEPGRILYLPSNAWTTPENFAEFRQGVLRRLRRYCWSHFWTLRV